MSGGAVSNCSGLFLTVPRRSALFAGDRTGRRDIAWRFYRVPMHAITLPTFGGPDALRDVAKDHGIEVPAALGDLRDRGIDRELTAVPAQTVHDPQ